LITLGDFYDVNEFILKLLNINFCGSLSSGDIHDLATFCAQTRV